MPRGWEGWRHRFLGDGLRWLIPAPLGYIQHSDTSREAGGFRRTMMGLYLHPGAQHPGPCPSPALLQHWMQPPK